MEISQAQLQEFRSQIGTAANYAARDVTNALRKEMWGDGHITKAELQGFLQKAAQEVNSASQIWGDVSQSVANSMFEQVMSVAGIDVNAEFYDNIVMSEDNVYQVIRDYLYRTYGSVSDVSMIDQKALLDFLESVSKQEVSQAARRSIRRNCRRTGTAYVLIPSSLNPCEFCMMQASRVTYDGGLHLSKKKVDAKGGREYFHPSCKCLLMPYPDAIDYENYDPNYWKDRWNDSREERVEKAFEKDKIDYDQYKREMKTIETSRKIPSQ